MSVTCDRLVVFYGYSGPQYNWNIVESGVKHHIPNNKHKFGYNAIWTCKLLLKNTFILGVNNNPSWEHVVFTSSANNNVKLYRKKTTGQMGNGGLL